MLRNNKDKALLIQNMFNNISKHYDILNRILSFRRDVRWRRQFVKQMELDDGCRVLDLACGTGDMINCIMKYSNPSLVVGADFSLNMIKEASKKVDTPLIAADACNLPFADSSFDCVTIVFGFRNVVDKCKALKEIFRVLDNNGKLCILEFSKPQSFLFKKLYWLYFRFFLPAAGSLISGNKEAYTYLPLSVMGFPDEDAYKKMIEEGGFTDINICYYDMGICGATVAVKSS